jgi:hypothetical protein
VWSMGRGTSAHTSALSVVGAAVVLAGLDLIGAFLARHWADHRSSLSLFGGIAVFDLLFLVYGKSLSYGQLGTITIAWLAVLQIGVMIFDRVHDGVPIPFTKWIAVGAIIALEA